ncbi:family 43 glycosylhydrolase [Adhaeribacter radiodurans]|uniref:Family 43 glycosylhydrolase n=2 Tax=Adhaeribacter radiodurans TaxID=2745197 RepID=A0A7L7LFB2_9BACT|nr:family 43 glycosylhydrolase [Adhaeribacter radiodurans]
MELTSPDSAHYSFTILIREELGVNNIFTLTVTGTDPQTKQVKTCYYQLKERNHTDYLNLFEKLALDFGLRTPQNRQLVQTNPQFKATYREVLSKNLNPQILYGYGDPAVIRVKQQTGAEEPLYYLLSTSNDAPHAFPIIRSRNLQDWEFVGFVFPENRKPAWAANDKMVSDYWAPEMHQINDNFHVYFVARDKDTRELCIGVAKSTHPDGPFLADEEPILKGNVIDPHVFVQDNGLAYLFWKEDNNDVWPGKLIQFLFENPTFIRDLFEEEENQITTSFIVILWPWVQTLEPMERFLFNQVFIEAIISRYLLFYDRLTELKNTQTQPVQQAISVIQRYMKTPMYAQQLSADGSSLIGERTKIIENDLAWEAHLVEGMWVTHHQNKFYLFYAGNDFSTDQYGIGVAIADSLLGPYRKMPQPFLQSTAEWWAPGHPSVVVDPNGKPQLFLHGYFPGKAGYKQFRALLSIPILFKEDRVVLGKI